MVYFFADERSNKNLLGRTGWLNRVRFGLVEHDQNCSSPATIPRLDRNLKPLLTGVGPVRGP